MSIRQRRRNRHRVGASQSRTKHPITLVLNIDVTKVNAIFAQTRDAISRLSGIQEIVAEAFQSVALIQPHVLRQMINARHITYFPKEVDYLGDPSCRFNARSPLLQCAVDPDGNCVTCRHFEKVL